MYSWCEKIPEPFESLQAALNPSAVGKVWIFFITQFECYCRVWDRFSFSVLGAFQFIDSLYFLFFIEPHLVVVGSFRLTSCIIYRWKKLEKNVLNVFSHLKVEEEELLASYLVQRVEESRYWILYILSALKNVFHVLIYEFNMGNRLVSHLLGVHRVSPILVSGIRGKC